MKVSLNWIKEYTSVDITVDELVRKIGAQLGAVEEVTDLAARYKGIVIAKVIKCESHPNADKLKVCLIDDGGVTPNVARDGQGLVQVVCGAPNVAEGQQVAWIPPGAIVPTTAGKEPFVLEAREIRGQMSNGMLGSPSELGVNEDHSGILVIEEQAKRGTPFAEAMKLDDVIIDIENKMFTHRPDLFGELGLAREIAGIQHKQFESPAWYYKVMRSLVFPASDNLPLKIENKLPKLVPRFMAVTLKDVHIGPSPLWLQSYLTRVGIRPISNIVDITNYLMYLTGQPLHAYDYDKVLGQSPNKMPAMLVVRHPEPDEKIVLLGGKEITPRPDAIMITSATKLIGIGGVMGGQETEVDNRTRNVILECATFDMYSIRRTSMEHGLFTDAVTRYNKGQSPYQNDKVLSKAVELVQELAEGTVGGRLWDEKTLNEDDRIVVGVSRDFVNSRLGVELSVEDMAQLLRNVEFGVDVNRDDMKVTVPFWRTDIEIPEDIVEEVGRLYGFDHLPLVLPTRDLQPAAKDELLEFKVSLRAILSRAGANEALTYSFVHGDLLTKVGQGRNNAFQLSNALSPELQYFRLSLTPSLLEKVHSNLKSDYFRTSDDNEFALFELGKTHVKGVMDKEDADLPAEHHRLSLVFAADDKTAKRKYSGAPYYQARYYLQALLDELGINWELVTLKDAKVALPDELAAPFEADRSAIVATREGNVLGIVGEYKHDVRQALKLPAFAAGFELGILGMKDALTSKRYQALPRFPKVVQDISLKVKSSTSYYNTLMTLVWALPEAAPKDTVPRIVPLDIYQNPLQPDIKTYTFRLWISSFERTLTAEEVNKLLNDLAAKAREELGAERV